MTLSSRFEHKNKQRTTCRRLYLLSPVTESDRKGAMRNLQTSPLPAGLGESLSAAIRFAP